jgi:hypothetical protein
MMTDDRNKFEQNEKRRSSQGRDETWPGVVQWDLGEARGYAGNIVWRCDALRAGRLYSRSLFGSQAEAEQFAARMKESEPDQMFSVEAIKASTMWN